MTEPLEGVVVAVGEDVRIADAQRARRRIEYRRRAAEDMESLVAVLRAAYLAGSLHPGPSLRDLLKNSGV